MQVTVRTVKGVISSIDVECVESTGMELIIAIMLKTGSPPGEILTIMTEITQIGRNAEDSLTTTGIRRTKVCKLLDGNYD